MSSGWPPEEDDRRWEPVRQASVVGAGHDSRGADRGYSGYARYPADADESGGSGPTDVPPGYDEDGWYAPADAAGPAGASHPSGPLPGTHGYGGSGGAGLYGAPVYAEAYRWGAGPVDTQYEDGPYEDERYGAAPYGAAEHGPAGYGQAHQPGAAHYAGVPYDPQPHRGEGDSGEHCAEDGYAPYDPDGSHPGQQAGYQPGGYAGHEAAGYGREGSGQPDSGFQDYAFQDYGYQDYGDPRYDDPSYGDLTYDDTPYPGSAHRGATQPGPPYAEDGVQDTGYGDRRHGSAGYPGQPGRAAAAGYGSPAYSPAYSAVETPGYADGQYRRYPYAAASTGGLRPEGGYAADDYDGAGEYEEDSGHEPGPYGSGDGPGYVAAEYASGQFPAGTGAIGELSAGMPDLAATGMLAATGIVDSAGISDHVELYNYHPGAAAATQGFLGAPAPVGTLDATGIDRPGYLDDPARGDHGIVLDGAEAGDAAGVLEGGSGFFDDAAPAEITAFDLPAASQSRGGKTGGTGALLRPRPSSQAWPPPWAQRRPQALVRAGRGRGRLRRGDRGHRHGRLPVRAGRPRAHPGDPRPAECLYPQARAGTADERRAAAPGRRDHELRAGPPRRRGRLRGRELSVREHAADHPVHRRQPAQRLTTGVGDQLHSALQGRQDHQRGRPRRGRVRQCDRLAAGQRGDVRVVRQ